MRLALHVDDDAMDTYGNEAGLASLEEAPRHSSVGEAADVQLRGSELLVAQELVQRANGKLDSGEHVLAVAFGTDIQKSTTLLVATDRRVCCEGESAPSVAVMVERIETCFVGWSNDLSGGPVIELRTAGEHVAVQVRDPLQAGRAVFVIRALAGINDRLPAHMSSDMKLHRLTKQGQEHLDRGEKVDLTVSGLVTGQRFGKNLLREAAILVTNQRLAVFAKKLGGFDFESYPFHGIESFDHRTGSVVGTLNIFIHGRKVKLESISKGSLQELVTLLEVRMREHSAATGDVADIPSQIEKLGHLVAAGLLTRDEFEAKKAQLLDRM